MISVGEKTSEKISTQSENWAGVVIWVARREGSETQVTSMPIRGEVFGSGLRAGCGSEELGATSAPSAVGVTVEGGLEVVHPASTTRPA